MGAHWVPDPLGTDKQRFCATRAQGWPSGHLIPYAHSPFHRTPQGSCWPTACPISRVLPILDGSCSFCVKWRCTGTLGRVGGTLGGVGVTWAPLSRLLVLV